MEPHQPELKKTAKPAKEELLKSKTENHPEQLAKLAADKGVTLPTSGNVRSRSTSTAVVGGAAAGNSKQSAAAVNGSDLKRKPW